MAMTGSDQQLDRNNNEWRKGRRRAVLGAALLSYGLGRPGLAFCFESFFTFANANAEPV
jgi:hypothetical protein